MSMEDHNADWLMERQDFAGQQEQQQTRAHGSYRRSRTPCRHKSWCNTDIAALSKTRLVGTSHGATLTSLPSAKHALRHGATLTSLPSAKHALQAQVMVQH
eukprot:TRINITY_DN8451_c0_g1_i12.p3 TRINITY_DN8451_c0_g1~~TRINITY_DN8451_c0_g1_i12.p3  ORF type:complete len:101 (-),score=15.36 TRINITY_DN8451_c0_g1_i12:126-428(-)